MTTMPSLVSRFATGLMQQRPDGYYRSKLFMTSVSSNPLISAGNPIFTLLERIGLSTTLPSIEAIRNSIEHELYAFQSRLARKNYADEFVAIGHYLLCATVDELLGKNYLRVVGSSVEFVAFTPLSPDNQGPQKLFFDIVNSLKEKAHQYLDLIELAYFCLISGFEGEKHLLADGRQTLENLIEELYQLIKLHRVHKPNQLLLDRMSPIEKSTRQKPMLLMGILTALSIVTLYVLSHVWLNHKANKILREHQSYSIMDIR